MMGEDNAVQVINTTWNGLQTVGEEDWRFLLEMFLNSQDITQKSRQTYSWALMRYFEWLRLTAFSIDNSFNFILYSLEILFNNNSNSLIVSASCNPIKKGISFRR